MSLPEQPLALFPLPHPTSVYSCDSLQTTVFQTSVCGEVPLDLLCWSRGTNRAAIWGCPSPSPRASEPDARRTCRPGRPSQDLHQPAGTRAEDPVDPGLAATGG